MSTLILGAVAYDPKVVTIWEGFKTHFTERGLAVRFRPVFQLRAPGGGASGGCGRRGVEFAPGLDRSRNGRRALVGGRRVPIAMRDTDRDLTSVVVVRAGGKIAALRDLAGKTVAVGAADSPQATLIPLLLFADAGLSPGRDFEVLRHDILVGKHGDHIGGEREAARALVAGRVDAACMIDGNHLAFTHEGTVPSGIDAGLGADASVRSLQFHGLRRRFGEAVDRFTSLLLSMSYDDPAVRPLLEMEGLKAWLPGRVAGYAQLNRAVDLFGTIDAWLVHATQE